MLLVGSRLCGVGIRLIVLEISVCSVKIPIFGNDEKTKQKAKIFNLAGKVNSQYVTLCPTVNKKRHRNRPAKVHPMLYLSTNPKGIKARAKRQRRDYVAFDAATSGISDDADVLLEEARSRLGIILTSNNHYKLD